MKYLLIDSRVTSFTTSGSCHQGAFRYHVRSLFWCKHN